MHKVATLDPQSGKRFFSTQLEAKASAFDLPESGTIGAWSQTVEQEVKLLEVALGGGTRIRRREGRNAAEAISELYPTKEALDNNIGSTEGLPEQFAQLDTLLPTLV